MLIGKRIEQLRKEYNISQRQLAEAISVSRKAVSRWESGQSEPDTMQLVLIAKALGTDMKTLTKGVESIAAKETPDIPAETKLVVEEAAQEPAVQIVEKVVEKIKIVEKPVIEYVETPVVKKIVRVKHTRNPIEFALVAVVCFAIGVIIGMFI